MKYAGMRSRGTVALCGIAFCPTAALAMPYYVRSETFDLHRHILSAPENLLVVTDFDLTLTTGGSDECHDILGTSPYMPEAVRSGFVRLLDFSVPFEPPLDGSGWWVRANEILVESGAPRRDEVRPIVSEAPTWLRPGAGELLQRLAALGVPVLVVSAGCTELIEAFLEAHNAMHANVRVSSNSLVWSDSGELSCVLPDPPVTSLNKGLTYERNAHWFEQHRGRRNLLILGDKCSDVQVVEGVPHNTLLSIGVLNGDLDPAISADDARLQQYLKAFDAVVVGDEAPFTPLVDLLPEAREGAAGAVAVASCIEGPS